jgi:hypothetical protein
MFVALTALALAAPLEAPIPVAEHGTVRVQLQASGSGTSLGSAIRLPNRGFRVDLVPATGGGLWVDVNYLDQAATTQTRERAWFVGVGGRGCAWFGRSAFGFGGLGRVSYGDNWTKLEAGGRSPWRRHLLFEGLPGLIVGPKGGGAYAWAGPVVTFQEIAAISPEGDAGAFEPEDPPVKLSGEIGGELHSADLLGYGDRRTAYISFGASIRRGSTWTLSVWSGLAF